VESKQLIDLSAPILFVGTDPWRRGVEGGPVVQVVSATSSWSPGRQPEPLKDAMVSDLHPGLSELNIGPARLVVRQPRGPNLIVVFEAGVCVFLIPSQFNPRLRASLFLKPAVPDRPSCATVLPEGGLVLGYDDGSVWLVDWFEEIRNVTPQRPAGVVALGTSERSRLVITWRDGLVEIRQVSNLFESNAKTLDLGVHTRSLLCQHPLGDVSFFAVGGEDGRIRLFDFDGVALQVLDCSGGAVTHLEGSNRRLSAIAGGHLLQWSIELSEQIRGSHLEYVWPIAGFDNELNTFAEVPRPGTRAPNEIASTVVLAANDGRVSLFRVGDADARNRQERHTLSPSP
jgi:hypothetical protein